MTDPNDLTFNVQVIGEAAVNRLRYLQKCYSEVNNAEYKELLLRDQLIHMQTILESEYAVNHPSETFTLHITARAHAIQDANYLEVYDSWRESVRILFQARIALQETRVSLGAL